ncbi:hypothetical protein GH811_18045 [Acetobacterium malicum]|uniref:Uncharacterized protein n=1 Tax=Acetobacterium malicum TaxID=52692 RepID=A0ABR6Z1V7_9FIRM|nr:hypothetical protein [Acetobacterium malicum]MBC3901503.1 hypothetical protein [Acetobacterium malicum]
MDGIELKRELANVIAMQCLKMITIGEEKRIDGGEPCVFFNFSGHVGGIYIAVYEKGWGPECYPDRDIRLDKYSTSADFKACLAYLQTLQMSRTMEEGSQELCVELDQAVGA